MSLFEETKRLLTEKGFSIVQEGERGAKFELEGKKYPERPRVLQIIVTITGSRLAAIYFWRERDDNKKTMLGTIDGVGMADVIYAMAMTVVKQIPEPASAVR